MFGSFSWDEVRLEEEDTELLTFTTKALPHGAGYDDDDDNDGA